MSQSGFSIYNALIKPLRDADTSGLLQRFLMGPQALHDRVETEILSLFDQVKPDKVRADLLPYLAGIVGFTAELRAITDRLSTTQLRRLVAMAVPLWNQRHTLRGLVNAIRLLTGRTPYATTWFGYRALLGEVQLMEDMLSNGGDFWVIGGGISTYDEYLTNIHVMDDGQLGEQLLLDVCRLMRPLGERIEVFLDDFLDRFEGELDKWVDPTGGVLSAQAVIENQTMKLLSAGNVQPVIPLLPTNADHVNYNIVFKFKMVANANLVARFYATSGVPADGNAYELSINTTASSGNATLTRYVAGVGTVLQGTANWPLSVPIIPNTWYACRISINNLTPTSRTIRVLIDGNQAMPGTQGGTEIVDTGAAFPSYGPYNFSLPSGANAWLDNVESWRNPARFATIGLSTPTERGGAVTKTSNFIL